MSLFIFEQILVFIRTLICLFLTLPFVPVFAVDMPNLHPESIATTELPTFSANSPKVQEAIHLLLNLAQQDLTYQYGSADPSEGGMDCSGTIFYAFTTMGIPDVPRSADLQYAWVKDRGHFYAIPAATSTIEDPTFAHLQPGDLLFWTGTYAISRTNNVTHVMMYLGKNKNGQTLMVGASNGRTYQGRKIFGVSVFDFKVPDRDSRGQFIGYGCVPQLNCEADT